MHVLSEILKGIVYSVEHMKPVQWLVVGAASVILGFLCLKSTKH